MMSVVHAVIPLQPLQVRWHPISDRTLASGSLDHHVRIWDAETGDCINHHDFGALRGLLCASGYPWTMAHLQVEVRVHLSS